MTWYSSDSGSSRRGRVSGLHDRLPRHRLALPLWVVLLGAATAQPTALRTDDGLLLQFADDGRIAALQAGDDALTLLSDGGFFLVDHKDQPEPVNLVPNPGFEQGTTGWLLASGQTVDEQTVHSDRRAARLHVPAAAAAMSNLGVTVAVKPGRRYRVGMWMRRRDCGVCGAYVSERGAGGTLTGAVGQMGLTVPQQDDVWTLAARELEVGPNTTHLNLRADIYRSTGTIWLDDFFIYEVPERAAVQVRGEVVQGDDGFRLAAAALSCRVDVRAAAEPSALRFDGKVSDLTGVDRAIGVSFRLPVAAPGWTWYDELDAKRTVSDPLVYRHTYACKTGEGHCSIYPWSALCSEATGLSVAVPLAQGPRVFVIAYNNIGRYLELTFFLGLTRDTRRAPSSAGFAFVLYRHDPRWGMRSAAEHYYALFPESFIKRPRFEGYLNYANYERFDPATHMLAVHKASVPDPSDFGEGYRFIWHLHGCYSFRTYPTENTQHPTDEDVLSFLHKLAEDEKTTPRHYGATSETINKLVHGPDGRISYIGDTRFWRPHEGYNRHDQPAWGLNFRVNEDPDVSPLLARTAQERVERFAAANPGAPFTACLTADAIEGYFANSYGPDFRREHFYAADAPLSFGKQSLEPCIPNTIWDFHRQAWWPLTERHHVLTYGNANKYEQTFTLPFCDIPMIENDWDTTHLDWQDRYCRALAHHKIWRFWRTQGKGEQDRDSVDFHFSRGLAYAIFPAFYPLVTVSGDIEQYRDQFRLYVPAIERLSRAGWEPVPHARADSATLAVERYGHPSGSNLHLVLANYSEEEVETSIDVDWTGLGLPTAPGAPPLVYDLLEGANSATDLGETGWRVAVPGKRTRAFWIGTRLGLCRSAFSDALYDLGRLVRLFDGSMNAEPRALLAACSRRLQRPPGSLAEAMQTALEVDRALDQALGMPPEVAPVDWAKSVFRIKTSLFALGAACSGLRCAAPRVVDAVITDRIELAFALTNVGDSPVTGLGCRVLSPWQDALRASAAQCDAQALATAGRASARLALAVPEQCERTLLPYVLEVTGSVGVGAVKLAVPVDLRLRPGITVDVSWGRAARGASSPVTLSVANRLPRVARGTLALGVVRGISFEPTEQAFSVPPRDSASLSTRVRVDSGVRLGQQLVPFAVNADDRAVRASGSLTLRVTVPSRRVTVGWADGAVQIDGKLDESAWQDAPTIPELGLLVSGRPASEKTEVWVLAGKRGLTVAFRCHESSLPALKAELTTRGAPLYRDDDIEIFLQPPGAEAPLQFAVNPLGTQSDSFGNDSDWLAAAVLADSAWTAEIFIPFEVLGMDTPPQPGDIVPAQFGRQQKPKLETTSWTPCRAFRDPNCFGELLFEGVRKR